MNKEKIIKELDKSSGQFFRAATDSKIESSARSVASGVFSGISIARSLVTQLDDTDTDLANTIKLLTNLEPETFLKELGLYGLAKEPQKVKVPAFVAEWIEYAKKKGDSFFDSFSPWDLYGAEYVEADRWIAKNGEIYGRAWLDGYEVEEESKYSVMVAGKYLIKMFHGRKDHKFVNEAELESWHSSAYKLTQKEIKEIDERYWTFAVPVEKV